LRILFYHLGQYILAISNRELIDDIETNSYNPEESNPKVMDKNGEPKLDELGEKIPKLDVLTRNSYKVIREKIRSTKHDSKFVKSPENTLCECARDLVMEDFVPLRPNKP